jgi:hypothetical protein
MFALSILVQCFGDQQGLYLDFKVSKLPINFLSFYLRNRYILCYFSFMPGSEE